VIAARNAASCTRVRSERPAPKILPKRRQEPQRPRRKAEKESRSSQTQAQVQRNPPSESEAGFVFQSTAREAQVERALFIDSQRKNAAVASFHGPHIGNESAQFYGACTPN
jgi:hypothetical protein